MVLGAVTPTHGETKVIDTLLDFRCEGVILLGPESTTAALDRAGRRLPTVVVGRRVRRSRRGCRAGRGWHAGSARWSIISSGWDTAGSCTSSGGPGSIAADRRNGYLRAMRRHGLDDAVEVIDGEFTENAGSPRRKVLLSARRCRPRWSAPTTAARSGCSTRCAGPASRCPGEVSVTGYDDSVLAQLGHIDLTSVSQEPREQANRAVEAVVERLDGGRTEPVSSVLMPQLVGPGDDGCASSVP